MNQATGPQPTDVRSQYHADFAMGLHSARHLRRVLRFYLVRSGLADVTDPAELDAHVRGVLDEGGRGPVIVAAVSDR
ncbi:hypothetical protein R2F25_25495 [Streptomyces sp. UP1A-1]|nr:hypothetical protein [Streptomyces sp. UP1A-1]